MFILMSVYMCECVYMYICVCICVSLKISLNRIIELTKNYEILNIHILIYVVAKTDGYFLHSRQHEKILGSESTCKIGVFK